jgi:hypothetical protein
MYACVGRSVVGARYANLQVELDGVGAGVEALRILVIDSDWTAKVEAGEADLQGRQVRAPFLVVSTPL